MSDRSNNVYRMIIYVSPDVETASRVIDAWRGAGVESFTILESSGVKAHDEILGRDDLPLMPRLRHVLELSSMAHRTMFTVVHTSRVEAVRAATEAEAGALSEHATGLLIVLPVEQVLGTDALLTPATE